MVDSLAKFANNSVVRLLISGITILGGALATLAVFILLDWRTSQAKALDGIAIDVRQISEGVAVLKGESAVINVKINELRPRVQRIEQKVFP